ncbi:hypothetical protein [Nocardia farcinica]
MTEPFATAHVAAELDWNDLDSELQRRVTEAAEKARKTLQENLDKWTLSVKVKLEPSIADFRRAARLALRELELTKEVKLRTSAAELKRWADNLKERIGRQSFTASVRPTVNTARFPREMQAALRQISRLFDFTIPVRPTVDTTRFPRELQRKLREMSRLFDFTIPVRVELDLATARARLESFLRERSMQVRVQLIGLDRLRNLRVPDMATLAGNVTKAASAMAVLGGAAGAALGAVGALGVGLAALGPAAMAGISTVAVGLSGIKDAFSALSAAEEAASTDAKATAKATKTATDQLTSAERARRDAVRDSRQAERDLTTARRDAQKAIRDLNLEVRGGVLSEKEAQLDLRDARRELANLKPGDDYERAQLRVAKAEQTLIETRYRNHDLAEKQAEANAKGVEGSDLVTAAQERLASAQERVDETTKAVADAQAALAEAASGASTSQEKAARKLAELSPNARAWVLEMRELKSTWNELVADPTQDALFAGSAQGIRELAEAALPTLGHGMTAVATELNALTRDFAAFWKAPENLAGIESIFTGTASFIRGMGPGLQQATQGFLSLGKAFEPVAQQVGASVGGLLGQIGAAFTQTFASGELTQLIGNFGSILNGLGQGLNPLIQGLVRAGNLIGPHLGPMLAQLGASLGQLAVPLGQLGATFLQTITPLLPQISAFAGQIAVALQPLLPILGQIASAVLGALEPAIGPLSQVAQIVGGALAQAISALAPSIGPLSTAFASLVSAAAPIVPVLAEIAGGLLAALAPALQTIFEAAAPVIRQIADLMLPVFRQLQPILAQVAGQIAYALVSAIEQLAPYIPQMAASFSQLVMALAPLMPQLVEIALSLLPPLLDIVIAILPQIQTMIDVFTWLATHVLGGLVVPVLRLFSENLGSAMSFAASAITTARDTIGGALSKMGEYFGGLGGTVSEVWDRIVRVIKRAVREIGEFLVDLPEIDIPKIPGFTDSKIRIGFGNIGQNMIAWANSPGAATGGRLIRGPGTGTSDSIPALLDGRMPLRVANGEFISTADAYRRGAPLLWALNNGWTPSPEFLRMLVSGTPGFAQGGLVSAKELIEFAKGVDGKPYEWGGVNWGDCSAAVAALANFATGRDPFGSRFATGNMGQVLADMGAQPGLGPKGSLNIGWFNGGPYGGHTSATLPNGVAFEMGGERGNGQYGGRAAHANDPMYTDHAHFPPEFFLGGDPGTVGGTSGGRPSKLNALGGGASSGGTSGGSGTSGGPSSSSSSSSSGGSSTTGGGGVTEVFVTNWPASIAATAPATVGDASQAAAQAALDQTGVPVIGATGEPPIPDLNIGTAGPATGIAAANAWAAQQDWAGQAQNWAVDALKSIIGEAADPFGLKPLTDMGIDRGVQALQSIKVADTMNFYGMDPQKVADETGRMLRDRMTPVAETYRAG